MTSVSLDMRSLLLLVARMWILRRPRVWVAPVDGATCRNTPTLLRDSVRTGVKM